MGVPMCLYDYVDENNNTSIFSSLSGLYLVTVHVDTDQL